MKNLTRLIPVFLSAILISCTTNHSSDNQNQATLIGVENARIVKVSLSADEFEKKLNQSNSDQLVDVRTPDEYSKSHLKGALNFDINDQNFEKQITKLNKTKAVFLYCHSGRRSARAADFLAANGFTIIYDLQGGISAWLESNKPLN